MSSINKKMLSSLHQTGLRFFCTGGKNFASTFKIRSKLADFFKHIHPDQMNQAPAKIKDENLLSLKNFNEYIDAINQNKSMEAKLLKFYISEKTNHKSKKFYSFNLELPDLESENMNDQKAQRLLDDIVNALNSKFKESQEGGSKQKGKKKSGPQTQSDVDKIHFDETDNAELNENEKMSIEQETIKPFSKRQYKTHAERLTEQRLESTINSHYVEAERQNLEGKLRQKVSFADTSSSKPMMWARMTMGDKASGKGEGIHKNYQEILNSLIDPKLIYFDESISNKEVQTFKSKMIPSDLKPLTLRDNDMIFEVCDQMQSYEPPICFYVSDHYSADEIPGFFTIPYNFVAKQLKSNWLKMKDTIEQEQQTYIQLYEHFQELTKELEVNNNIIVKMGDKCTFKNCEDLSEKIIMLKRMSKFRLYKVDEKNFFPKSLQLTFHPMEPEEYEMALKHYLGDNLKELISNSKDQQASIPTAKTLSINGSLVVFHLVNFKDSDFEGIIRSNNVSVELNYKYGMQDRLYQQKKALSENQPSFNSQNIKTQKEKSSKASEVV